MKSEDLEELFWGAFLEKHEMHSTQGRRDMLRSLHREMLPATDLAERTSLTQMAVYKFLKEVVGKGWVDKVGRRPVRYRLKVNLPGRLPSMGIADDNPRIVVSMGKKTMLTIAFQSGSNLGIRVIRGRG